MTPQEVLLKAAELLERDGWCQRAFEDGRRHCAAGAINRSGSYYEIQNAYVLLHAHLGQNVVTWNDDRTRSAAEVIAALRAAAGAA